MLLLLLLVVTWAAPVGAQVPGFTWASAVGSPTAPSHSRVSRIVTDRAGNVYVMGIFRGSLTLGRTTLTAVRSDYDLFVAKLDSTGAYQWAVQAGGERWDMSLGLALDARGNLHLTGYCDGNTARFGPLPLFTPTSLFDGMGANLFVATLSPDGTWLRVVRAGGSDANNYLVGHALTVDAQGNIYVTGSFQGREADFSSIRLASTGIHNVFVACLAADGTWRWALAAGGDGSDEGRDIAVDAAGGLHVTGSFDSQQFTLGGLTLRNANAGRDDGFVFKLSAATGAGQWAVPVSSPGDDVGRALALTADGEVYATGFLSGTTSVGGLLLPKTGADADMFVARFDGRTGATRWAVRGGGLQQDVGGDIAVDADGTSYVSGGFAGEVAEFGPVRLRSAGKHDALLASLDAAGNWRWAVGSGSIEDDHGHAVVADGRRGAYLAGTFEGPTATFGAIELPSGPSLWESYAERGFVTRVADLTLRSSAAFSIWPNPARRAAPVWAAGLPVGLPLLVFDALGRLVVADARPAHAFQSLMLPTGLAAGLYMMRCGPQARKLVLTD